MFSLLTPSTKLTLWLISLVPFIWGMLTSITNLLVPYLQDVYSLSYTQSIWVQVIFSLSPLIISLPMAAIINRTGYKPALIGVLCFAVLGCILVLPAAWHYSYRVTLVAIFIVAMSVAAMQVVTNPIVTSLGSDNTISNRMTFVSSINALGTTVAPWLAAAYFFPEITQSPIEKANNLQIPFILLATFISIVTITLLVTRFNTPPTKRTQTSADVNSTNQVNNVDNATLNQRHYWLGVIAIFCYTGTEVSIGTYLVSYLNQAGNLPLNTAGQLVTFYWGGAMAGRIAGCLLFSKINARKVLCINAALSGLIILGAILLPGLTSGYLMIGLGLCHSIMYPVIFSLAIRQLGDQIAKASSILIMAGAGGTILPLIQALLADQFFIANTFLLSFICYVFILFYSAIGYKNKDSIGMGFLRKNTQPE
ncbi:glucose/galactose MFS transporter [Photobacterium profundum]|uniref:glucose/galactose MFS transporter n=1 Tax=Photobacterium profundum TaxID=74109 RepID=UPI003D0C6675